MRMKAEDLVACMAHQEAAIKASSSSAAEQFRADRAAIRASYLAAKAARLAPESEPYKR